MGLAEGRRTELVGGLETLVVDTGGVAPTLGTLVFIHGVGNDMSGWDRVIASLPPGWRTVRYSLRGHGRSLKPPPPYTLQDFVEDHNQLVEALELGPHHLVGCSLGGLIAQGVALTSPPALNRLVLISCIAGRTEEQKAAALARFRALQDAGGPAGMAHQSGERWFTAEFQAKHPEIVTERLEAYRKNDPVSYLASYRVLAESDLIDELNRIANETLVITGEFDIGSPPAMAQNIVSRIPRSDLRVIPGQKHQLLVERPALIAELIDSFAQQGLPGVKEVCDVS